MKSNEIGHFKFDPKQKDYPHQLLHYDGKDIQWLPNFEILGVPPTIPSQSFTTDDCLIDLQAGSMTCYYAADVVIGGVKYIWLLGNGWSETGFPFTDDTFDPEKPYEMGKGCYAMLKGKARNRFIKLAKQDYIPSFNECFTNLFDFVLMDEK